MFDSPRRHHTPPYPVKTLCYVLRKTCISTYSGDPGGIRTPDLQIRNLPLYPAELRGRIVGVCNAGATYKQ